LNQMFRRLKGLTPPDWAIMTRMSRSVAGTERRFWLLCISGDPVIEYRRFFTNRAVAPKYLAFSAHHHDRPAVHNYKWTGPLARAVQDNVKAEPEFVVTDDFGDTGTAHWPWALPWTRFTGAWRGFTAYALPSRQPKRVAADETGGKRKVVIQRDRLTPATVGDAEAVVISPELHRQFQWPKKLKLIVLWHHDYKPDARTLRMNPRFKVSLIGWEPLEKALLELDTLCKSMRVKRVASISLGFEDEGRALRQWRQSAGPIRELTLHLDLPGNIEAFGPFADRVA
jgi:hypothetical protein